MFGPDEIENLAESADLEQEKHAKFSHNMPLHYTHSVNGIRLEKVHGGHPNGLFGQAAQKIASLLSH